MSKTKKQLRAEAVERLRAVGGDYDVPWYVALLGIEEGDSRFDSISDSEMQRVLIDLLTDDEPNEGNREKPFGTKTCHIEGYDDGIDENYDGDLYSYGPPTWFLSCGHQGEGIDAPDFCPVCGAAVVDSETNWEKLFGTPERTAETLKRMDVDVFNWCVDDSSNHENCRACPYEYDYYGCYLPDGFSMLEWLKGASDEV